MSFVARSDTHGCEPVNAVESAGQTEKATAGREPSVRTSPSKHRLTSDALRPARAGLRLFWTYRSRSRSLYTLLLLARSDNALRVRSEPVAAARSNPLRADHVVERVTEAVDLGPACDHEPCRVARVDQLEIDALKAMAEILPFATSRAGDLSVDDGKTSVDAHRLQTSLVVATSGDCVAGPGLLIG